MKPESQIDQKQLIKIIGELNSKFKTKIRAKGSIIDLAEAFATGVEALGNRNETLPEEVIDFYNDLFSDEAIGYKDVEIDKAIEPPPEEPDEELEPYDEELPKPEEEGIEEVSELEPEEELPQDEEELDPEPEEEELEEEEPPPPLTKRGRGRPPKQPKLTANKKPAEKKILKGEGDINMLQKLESITKRPEIKEFVKTHGINIKLKNNESAAVWKAKIKKMVESTYPALTSSLVEPTKPEAEKPKKVVKKLSGNPKVERSVEKAPQTAKVIEIKPKAKKKVSKKTKSTSLAKNPFGILVDSLTHKFVEMVYKKPCTMKMVQDAGCGKHPKTLRKLIAMGYMQKDNTGIISMTVNGRKVYGQGR